MRLALFCATKQWINVVQLVKAAITLAEGDVEMRRRAKNL
jgi:CDP-diacylglycerol--inositol 3-phosphatidyltransferase